MYFRWLLVFALPLAAEVTPVDQVAWIAGCWQGEARGRVFEEHWMKPAAGIMLGMNRTIASGAAPRVTSTEFLSLEMHDGKFSYVARPSQQTMTAFPLVSATMTEAIFENLKHDFPQRIIYRKTADGLFARVESADGKKAQDFPMKAVPCK